MNQQSSTKTPAAVTFEPEPTVAGLEESKALLKKMIDYLKALDEGGLKDKQVENILQAVYHLHWRGEEHRTEVAEFAAEQGLPGNTIIYMHRDSCRRILCLYSLN